MTQVSEPQAELQALTHTAESGLRRPTHFVSRLLHDLHSCRHVAWEMFRRDLTSQYRQSMLGVFLMLVPAITATTGAIVFQQAKLINVGDVAIPYPIFVLCGTMLWTTFTEALSGPIDGLMAEQALLSRANIPPEAVVISRVGQVFFNFAAKLLVIVLAATCYRVHVPRTMVLAPLGLVLLVALGTAIGLMLAPINLLYRDVSRAVGMVTSVWFFITPIIFTTRGHGLLDGLVTLNPVTALLVTTRELAFRGVISMPWGFAVMATLTLVLLGFGMILYRVAMPIVIDRANA